MPTAVILSLHFTLDTTSHLRSSGIPGICILKVPPVIPMCRQGWEMLVQWESSLIKFRHKKWLFCTLENKPLGTGLRVRQTPSLSSMWYGRDPGDIKDVGGGGVVAKSCLTLVTPCQAPLSMGFSKARILDSPLQGIFPTEESNPGLLHCRQTLYQLSYQGNPSR